MHCSLLTNGLFYYPEAGDNTAFNRPCCVFKPDYKNMQRIGMHEISSFYKDKFRNNITDLLSIDKKPEPCNFCWKNEELGNPSMRTRVNVLNLHDDTNKLKYFELNTGNVCNIKCIMCNPKDSLVTKKYYEMVKDKFPTVSVDNEKYTLGKHRGLKKSNIDSIDWKQFDKLEYIKATGGDTFYTKEFWYFLEKVIDNLAPNIISLIIVTNNTVQLDNYKIEILKKFKKIKIYSSVDGIGNLCNTIRAGSEWNVVNDNIKHLIELHEEYPDTFLHTEPHSVVQFANILQLDEIVDWWESTAINEEFKNKHYLRILDQPKWFEAGIVPKNVKDIATKRYKKIKKLNHVLKYLESFKSNEDYIVKYTIPIFEEICKINNQNPYSSKAYEVIKNA